MAKFKPEDTESNTEAKRSSANSSCHLATRVARASPPPRCYGSWDGSQGNSYRPNLNIRMASLSIFSVDIAHVFNESVCDEVVSQKKNGDSLVRDEASSQKTIAGILSRIGDCILAHARRLQPAGLGTATRAHRSSRVQNT
ncbi:hypothetical protein AB1N83_010284 [Pleurotus pulmonarius]